MKKLLFIAVVLIILLPIMASCDDAEGQRDRATDQRAEVFARAEALYPIPFTENFPAREMLVKFTEREDLINHPYYIYVFSDVGTIIGYYVAQSYPVSTNAFLSSTEDLTSYGIATAPSLDGIYYGGSGASSGDGWFFFDATTDALVILYGFKIFVLDQPLMIDAPRIIVSE